MRKARFLDTKLVCGDLGDGGASSTILTADRLVMVGVARASTAGLIVFLRILRFM
jgi:hypothetical protein